VEVGARIKAEFLKDGRSTGGFTIKGCGTSIHEDISQVQSDSDAALTMYGFNLYIEASTLSPEPQLLIQLERGASTSWTQRLQFGDYVENVELEGLAQSPAESFHLKSISASMISSRQEATDSGDAIGGTVLLVAAICFVALVVRNRWSSRRNLYTRIEDG
jgi:hypothetical protein